MPHSDYSYTGSEPLNEEPPVDELIATFITKKGYDRNHGPIPHLDASTHKITLTGLVNQELSLSVAELQSLPQHSVICALQCAGNRRHTMRTKLKEVSGIDWFDGAVMNCKWTGPLLRDVLQKAGLELSDDKWDGAHVAFACHQTPCQDDEWYGASIPLSRAMDPKSSVLLALEMNDAPLPANHGAPVRVVTPGIAGARSVKWLDKITVQLQESENFYQQHDYKILPPEADSKENAEGWWGKVPAIQDMPVNSVIGVPKSESKAARDDDGKIEVKGYALPSGADGPIAKVEVSVDEGQTWTDAELLGAEEEEQEGVELKWAWCLWKAKVAVLKSGKVTILSRATDTAGNTQVRCPEWNFRGVAYNGYGEATNVEVA